jgi:GT2 family glycosyltransferase
MAQTDGDLVVLLNPDATADRQFLERITAPFQAGRSGVRAAAGGVRQPEPDRLAAVTGRILLTGRFRPAPGEAKAYVAADGRRWARLPPGAAPDAGVELLNSTGSQISRSGNGRDRSWLSPADTVAPPEVFGFCGGACALLRTAVEAVGGFDERLFLYYEDTDLSWRLRRLGWTIRYAADAIVRHQHSASSGIESTVFLRHNIRNRVLVTARNGPSRMFCSAVLHTVGHLLRTLPRSVSRGSGARARIESAASWWALHQLAIMLPGYLVDGRRADRAGRLPRHFVYAWTVEDGVG